MISWKENYADNTIFTIADYAYAHVKLHILHFGAVGTDIVVHLSYYFP